LTSFHTAKVTRAAAPTIRTADGDTVASSPSTTATVSAIDTAWPAAIGPSAPTTAARDRSCRPSATANSHPIAGLMP